MTLRQINVNPEGGVPKYAVSEARLETEGVAGDKQRNRKYHGGPMRAVCLYSWELIQSLQAEGHPIDAGTIGENLTLQGVDWQQLAPGTRLRIGEAELEITSYVVPCRNIRASFLNDNFMRIAREKNPGWGRYYARVVHEGLVRAGDEVKVF
ncbi:MAG TPA: MOSC domain-containing protein [Abditibacteriaceae bacterium]|jgi:MOSC domain-containing protein YiiM